MASVTRSTRRADAFPHVNGDASFSRATSAAMFEPARRPKRATDAIDRGLDDFNPKKTRIAVEIRAKPQPRLNDTISRPQPHPTPVPAPVAKPPLAKQATPPAAPLPPDHDPNITKHQAKVINGIKHELDRLQPQPQVQASGNKEQGRKLRSQEATRFKSELSAYFPDYDEVIGNDPKEQHTLNLDTPIVIVDSNPRRVLPNQNQQSKAAPLKLPVRGYGDALYTDVFDAQRIDFRFLETQTKNKSVEDPLPDKLFEPIHKRAERLERSIRNSEKGRAQHEKDQIIRLLEGLQGHDWLRVMGVSGITDTKKKLFEPAREYFIKGCQSILDKFRNWNLEEKRRKLEKERTLAEQAEELRESEGSGETDALSQDDDEDASEEGADNNEQTADDEDGDDTTTQDDTSEGSSPAKQLRQEAMARSKIAAARRQSHKAPTKISEMPKEFKSFFNKKHERDGALNRTRRTGRKVLAWGHPVPEFPETDFDLPEEYRDEETMRSRARKKRRDRRGTRG